MVYIKYTKDIKYTKEVFMLYLKRDLKDDGIVVISPEGKELKFYITDIRGTRAKLGFEDFNGFQVWRSELWERKRLDSGSK